MQEKLHSKYGLEASHSQLYRAKRKCQDVLEGNHGDQYKLLPTYAMEVRKTNPGSLFKMQYDRPSLTVNPMFQRLFVCFEAMKAGFLNGCRPFLGIDGCHLKGPYGGVLISAVALDGNNGLFPIAIGIVEVECKESWGFFLSNLQTIIGSSNYVKPWTIMSDQQKGLEKLVTELIPEASHRKCCRHIFQNFKARFPGLVLRKQFWVAARAYTERHFNHAMNIIKETNIEAHAYLIKLGVHTWARHTFDHAVRSDHVTNNLAESFNNWIGHLRGKPILTMLEGIRCKVMTRIQKRYEKGLTWGHGITANIKKQTLNVAKIARDCQVQFCGGEEYEVKDTWGVSHLVHLGVMDCVCRKWEISGIPCKHALAAITYGRKDVEDYVHPYFSKEMYLKAYAGMIHPILDHSMWTMCPGDPLDPPPLKRMPGRPRKNRRRQEDEGPAATSQSKRSQTLKCTWCQQFGHNKRTCQRGPIRGRGRGRGSGNRRGAGSGRGASSGRGSVSETAASGRGSSFGSISVSGMGSSMARGRGRSMTRGRGRASNSGRGRSNNNARRMGSTTGRGRNVGDNGGSPMPSQCVTQHNQWASF